MTDSWKIQSYRLTFNFPDNLDYAKFNDFTGVKEESVATSTGQARKGHIIVEQIQTPHNTKRTGTPRPSRPRLKTRNFQERLLESFLVKARIPLRVLPLLLTSNDLKP